MYTVHGQGVNLPFFLVQINLQHIQAQPYGICIRVISLTETYLYVEHETGKQSVPFLKSLVIAIRSNNSSY